ncbi:hypothetical protein ACWD3I_48160 [Streptomyces sp. NPDC002817]|uniref:hypothetical protein n=1 Tax=Streptomyces sp. NPDC088357 TaxID=3154655 RepID=UPI00343C1A87
MTSRNNPVPGEGDNTSAIPDEMWQQFIEDSERAIRGTAPRELSAQERAAQALPPPLETDTDTTRRRTWRQRHTLNETGPGPLEAVGELWTPEDPWTGPAWRDMETRGRRRRVSRVLGMVAALVLLLGALSHLPTASGDRPPMDSEATWTQPEDVSDALQTATACPALEDPDPCMG